MTRLFRLRQLSYELSAVLLVQKIVGRLQTAEKGFFSELRIIDSFQSDIKCQPQIIANRAHIWLKGYATVVYCTGLPTFLGKNETKELNF